MIYFKTLLISLILLSSTVLADYKDDYRKVKELDKVWVIVAGEDWCGACNEMVKYLKTKQNVVTTKLHRDTTKNSISDQKYQEQIFKIFVKNGFLKPVRNFQGEITDYSGGIPCWAVYRWSGKKFTLIAVDAGFYKDRIDNALNKPNVKVKN